MNNTFLRELRQKTRKSPAVLTAERKKEIESIINRIRKQHGIKTADFDLIEFLTLDYSFEVQVRPLEDKTTALLLVDEKHLVKGSSSNRVMIINQYILENDKNFRNRRFICAHQFGHFILHKRADQATFAVRDTPDHSSLPEQEAEYFAYCLLMPAELINNLYNREDARSDAARIKRKYGFSMGDLVSELFNVTKRTAVWRLKELGKTENLENETSELNRNKRMTDTINDGSSIVVNGNLMLSQDNIMNDPVQNDKIVDGFTALKQAGDTGNDRVQIRRVWLNNLLGIIALYEAKGKFDEALVVRKQLQKYLADEIEKNKNATTELTGRNNQSELDYLVKQYEENQNEITELLGEGNQ